MDGVQAIMEHEEALRGKSSLEAGTTVPEPEKMEKSMPVEAKRELVSFQRRALRRETR
jgi:hypothetical protein